ncbi:S9 family peptidase [Actomonas aquatica]|uniref:Prolyl oligopeptidase family serine peptidase n=1 Tax=Actomonas aquatica TaxID=2866162 RepID=A0ABZ1C9E4_9BACT|nr:prolyl oligopeptidase family serine peptidase [Opitutus sp. WL0086]WRQ87204.1 prolyl oligopeptidase family serine peptidase [Opitutus sp. WL0086]
MPLPRPHCSRRFITCALALLIALTAPPTASAQLFGGASRPVARQDGIERQLAPPRASLATLSRDGRHLAYAVHAGGRTRIDIVATTPPYAKQSIQLGDTRGARLLSLQWTSPDRLVLATEDWAIATATLSDGSARIVLDPSRFTIGVSGQLDTTFAARDNPLQFERLARPPRLLALAPDAPDTVIVEGVAGRDLEDAIATTARLDLTDGSLKELEQVRLIAPAMRTWADPQGRYRLLEDRTYFPLQWRARDLRANGRLGRWRPLEDVIASTLATAFEADADRLWLDRALPLGFNRDGTTLYFATNVDRDSYALRAWDFARDSLTDLQVDLPGIDLAPPVADVTTRFIGSYERQQRRVNAALFYTDFAPVPPPNPLVFDRASGELAGVRVAALPAGAHWIDPQLAALQPLLERDHPGRLVHILDWDDARQFLLVNVASAASTGRYYLYRTADAAWVEILRRDEIDRAADHHRVESFTLTADDGSPLHGRVTYPRQPLGKTPPLVCFLPDGPWQVSDHTHSAPAQMLAEYGCLVLEVDYRGSAGHGNATLLAGRDAPDHVAHADLTRAMAWLAEKQTYNPRRVALIGVGYGGWLALRAAQLSPSAFSSVAALNAFDDLDHLFTPPPERERPDGTVSALRLAQDMQGYLEATRRDLDATINLVSGGTSDTSFSSGSTIDPSTYSDGEGEEVDENVTYSEENQWNRYNTTSRFRALDRMVRHQEPTPVPFRVRFAQWFFGEDTHRNEAYSVSEHADLIDAAVLLCATPDEAGHSFSATRKIAAALADARHPAEVWELPASPWNRSIAERPEVWLRVAEFLNETLLNFDVEIGPSREVPDAP